MYVYLAFIIHYQKALIAFHLQIQLTSVPVFIEVSGLFDVEYRLIVSCRDANIYTIKRGFKTGRLCVQLNSQPVGLLRSHNNIIVACLDGTLSCYTTNGNCIWKLQQPAGITAVAAIDIEILGLSLIAVALDNKEIHFYNNKIRVDKFVTESVITSMKFGRYGREDNTLVMVSRSGHLSIRIIKRTAKFNTSDPDPSSFMNVSTVKLSLPKKTRLFVDQSIREREEARGKSLIGIQAIIYQLIFLCRYSQDIPTRSIQVATYCVQSLRKGYYLKS